MEKFLETYNFPKLNQGEAESLNRLITASEIADIIKKLLAHKSPGPDSFTGEFYKEFKEELTLILLNYSKISKEKENFQILFIRLASSQSQNQIKTQYRKKTTGQYC